LEASSIHVVVVAVVETAKEQLDAAPVMRSSASATRSSSVAPVPPSAVVSTVVSAAAAAVVVVDTGVTRGLDPQQHEHLQQNSHGKAGLTSQNTYAYALKFRWEAFTARQPDNLSAMQQLKKKNIGAKDKAIAVLQRQHAAELKKQLVTSENGVLTMNEGLIDRFFHAMWLDFKENDGKVYRLTAATCDSTAKAVCWEVNQLLGAAGLKTIKSIKDLVSVAKVCGHMDNTGKNRLVKGKADLQAEIHQLMPAHKIELAEALLRFEVDEDHLNCSCLARFNMYFFLTHVLQTGARCEDELNIVQAFEFVRQMLPIGPNKAVGTGAMAHILHGGKTNPSGKLEFMASIAHMNPSLCAVSAAGLLKIYRWCCLGETFLNFKGKDYDLQSDALFETFVVRSDEQPCLAMPYQRIYSGFVKLSEHTSIFLPKPTHFGRADLHNVGNNSIVDSDAMRRGLRRKQDEADRSYIQGTPAIVAVLAAGGEEHTHQMRCFNPPHCVAASSTVVKAVVESMLPDLYPTRDAIEEQLLRMLSRGMRSDAKKGRLHTVLGFLKAAVQQVEAAVVQAAARPRGADSEIVTDSLCMARLFPKNPVYKKLIDQRGFPEVELFVRGLENATIAYPCAAMSPATVKLGHTLQAVVAPLNGQMLATHRAVIEQRQLFPDTGPTAAPQAPLPPSVNNINSNSSSSSNNNNNNSSSSSSSSSGGGGGGLSTAAEGTSLTVLPQKNTGKRRMTKDATALLGIRPVPNMGDFVNMTAFWNSWVQPHLGTLSLEDLERDGALWRSSTQMADVKLRKALKTKMSKFRLVVAEVEHEVTLRAEAEEGAPVQEYAELLANRLPMALKTVDMMIPQSSNKRSKKRNWEGLLTVIREKKKGRADEKKGPPRG
jgi:hypothetical protein